MSSSDLKRWSGLAAMLAGTLIMISALLGFLRIDFAHLSEVALTRTFTFYALGYLFGGVLLLIGLVGLYTDQSEVISSMGAVVFLTAFLGTALFVGVTWDQAVGVPSLAREAPELLGQDTPLPLGFRLSSWLFSLGWLLFGVVTLRAGRYPREAAWLLIIGAVINFIPRPGTEFVLAAAVVWLGFELFSGRSSRADTRAPQGTRPAGRRTTEIRRTRDDLNEGGRRSRAPRGFADPREEDTRRLPGWREDEES
ncbi:MAG: hypothetical protein JOZ19_08275 [Rubrobacter sp.]|nr:hypothetical protein [Rubrobacter sp.]